MCPAHSTHAYNIWGTCEQNVGNIAKIYYQHAGDMLATCWQHVLNMLGTYWQHANNLLATSWQHADNMLATCWQHAGNLLATCRQHAGNILTTCWSPTLFINVHVLKNFETSRRTLPVPPKVFSRAAADSVGQLKKEPFYNMQYFLGCVCYCRIL